VAMRILGLQRVWGIRAATSCIFELETTFLLFVPTRYYRSRTCALTTPRVKSGRQVVYFSELVVKCSRTNHNKICWIRSGLVLCCTVNPATSRLLVQPRCSRPTHSTSERCFRLSQECALGRGGDAEPLFPAYPGAMPRWQTPCLDGLETQNRDRA
jgi:hypothetical protein